MKPERGSPIIDLETLPRIPSWVTSARAETLEDVAFLTGAALAVLHLVASRGEVPQPLLRDRLALRAAEACVALAGRPERAADLRDEVHLLRPGDLPGPAGAICQRWRQAAARPMTPEGLHRALPDLTRAQIVFWLEEGQGGPVDRMAQVLEAVLAEDPRAEATALILADATLARVMGWNRLLPLFAAHLTMRDLRKTGDELRRACHRAVLASCREAVPLAHDLARRAAKLQSVAPKLRAKGAGKAVEIFLSRDAVAPSEFTAFMSDRAARRLCDRLVTLGAVRELTGRDTFRLYGV